MPIPTRFYQRMKGQRVIVTGAGSQGEGVGTGKAIAWLMAAEGARVALVDRNYEQAEATRKLIAEQGGEAAVFVANVTLAADCNRAIQDASAWLGGLDVLVNNVGAGSGSTRLENIEPDQFHANIDINLTSVFLMTRAAIPALLEGTGKAVINIASIAGMRAHGSAAYGPAKAATIQLTKELAVMYGREGLRANTIAPGHIFTPLVANYSDVRDMRRKIGPLGIEGDAWDVAQASIFLASSEARFITGACLPVDGGVSALGPWAAVKLAQDDPTQQ